MRDHNFTRMDKLRLMLPAQRKRPPARSAEPVYQLGAEPFYNANSAGIQVRV